MTPKNNRFLSDCINAVCDSQGIEDSISIKHIRKMIGQSIITANKEQEKYWPLTPQDK